MLKLCTCRCREPAPAVGTKGSQEPRRGWLRRPRRSWERLWLGGGLSALLPPAEPGRFAKASMYRQHMAKYSHEQPCQAFGVLRDVPPALWGSHPWMLLCQGGSGAGRGCRGPAVTARGAGWAWAIFLPRSVQTPPAKGAPTCGGLLLPKAGGSITVPAAERRG